jgi:hypothetical protein
METSCLVVITNPSVVNSNKNIVFTKKFADGYNNENSTLTAFVLPISI